MTKAVALGVGMRYAFSRRSSISFISTVAVAGLALSVAVLVVVVSVINGFEREFRERVFGMLPHLTLNARDPLRVVDEDLDIIADTPGVTAAVPFIQGAGLAAVGDRIHGVLITGIDGSYGRVSDLPRYLQGRIPEPGEFGAVIGAGVAKRLELGLGGQVTLVLPTATVTPAGLFPRQKRFVVTGVVRSESEVDSRAVYVNRSDAARLFRLGDRVHGFQLRVEDLFAADAIGDVLTERLGFGRIYARSWMRSHGTIYHAINVQKTTMFVLLSFLVGVAAFNLVSTLVMVVDRRSSDIAILRTLGSDSGTVVLAFVLLGVFLGTAGILVGLLVGGAIAYGLPGLYLSLTRTFELGGSPSQRPARDRRHGASAVCCQHAVPGLAGCPAATFRGPGT